MKTGTHRFIVEEMLPIVPAVFFLILWSLCGFPMPSQHSDLMAGGLAFASIAGGFLVTAWSIIVSASNRRIIRKLIDSPVFFDRFNRFFKHSIYFMLSLIVISICGFFWENSKYQMGLFIFCFVLSASMAFRFGYVVYSVINNTLTDKKDSV